MKVARSIIVADCSSHSRPALGHAVMRLERGDLDEHVSTVIRVLSNRKRGSDNRSWLGDFGWHSDPGVQAIAASSAIEGAMIEWHPPEGEFKLQLIVGWICRLPTFEGIGSSSCGRSSRCDVG